MVARSLVVAVALVSGVVEAASPSSLRPVWSQGQAIGAVDLAVAVAAAILSWVLMVALSREQVTDVVVRLGWYFAAAQERVIDFAAVAVIPSSRFARFPWTMTEESAAAAPGECSGTQ